MLKDHRGAKLHPECLEAVQRAAKLCAGLGHVVEEADPELDMVALRPMNARISATNTARLCNMRWRALGREPNADDVEAVTWAVYHPFDDTGRPASEARLFRPKRRCSGLRRARDGISVGDADA